MSNGFVMITGASSGIGKAFAAQFAKKGYDFGGETERTIAGTRRGMDEKRTQMLCSDG